MQTPFWRNIIKTKTLNKKNRYVLTYMSVFFILMFTIILLSSFKPKNTNIHFPDTNDTIYVYDTIYYYDTTYYYDTIYISKEKIDTNRVLIKKPKFARIFKNNSKSFLKAKRNKLPYGKYLFSVDFSISPMFLSHNFSSDFIYEDATNINKNSVSRELSRMFGLGVNFHNIQTTFSSGIFFTTYNEKFNYLVTDYLTDTILAYNYFTTTKITIDTIEFYNIDSLLVGDTVIEYYYDTTRITTLDSLLVPKVDSVEYKKNDKADNSYRFIEIPLIFSYNIYKQNFSISPQIGIITSFFMNSKGKIVSLADINQSVDIEDETKFAKLNFSIYGGVKVNYFITKRIDFFTSAYFKRGLNSMFIDYPIVSKFNSFGLNFGLKYKFIY